MATNNPQLNTYINELVQASQPVTSTQVGVQNSLTPEQMKARVSEIVASYPTVEERIDQSPMKQISWNPYTNAVNNIRRMGTGLTNIWANREQIPELAWDYLSSNPNYAKDFVNTVLADYNFNTDDIGKKSALEIGRDALIGAWENPVSTALDLGSLGAWSFITKGAKGLSKANDVEKKIASLNADVANDSTKAMEALKKAETNAIKNGVKFEDVVKSAETGMQLPEEALSSLEELRNFSKMYDDMAKKYSPSTYVGQEGTAIAQKILRDRLDVNPSATYAQVGRDIEPYMELIRANKAGELENLAKTGNTVAQEVLNAKRLFDNGKIFPVTHGLANVEKLGEKVVRRANDFAGQFTKRAYGNASYTDIAKQLKRPATFMENLASSYVDNLLAREIDNGFFRPTPDIKPADMRYLNKEILATGDFKKALESASKNPVLDTDVPIDKWTLDALKNQRQVGGFLGDTLKAIYDTGRGTLLSQGTYLGANALTGLSNAVINSGQFILSDVLDAIKSQGRLAKRLGTYRYDVKPQFTNIPALRQVQQANYYTGGALLKRADEAIQNVFAEIASNAELRKLGVKSEDRLKYIDQLDKIKLGEVITDVKNVSLQDTKNIPIPKTAQDLAFAVSPFWRWYATASKSVAKNVKDSPLLGNIVLTDFLANIGFDREMQNRLNLNVSLDKPYVSYKFDSKTGQIKEVSADFIPLITTLKMLDIEKGYFAPTIPIFTAFANLAKGKDKYGNPIKRSKYNDIITQTIGTKRYQTTPDGRIVEVEGSFADEYLTTAIREFLGFPNLVNKTVMPALAPFFSPTGEYYQPYGNSIFGTFERTNEGNILQSGNVNKGRTLQDVLNAFTGIYERPYYETQGSDGAPLNRRIQRQFWRNDARLNRQATYGSY